MANSLVRVAKWLVGTRKGRYALGGLAAAGAGAEAYRKFRQHVVQPFDNPMGYSQVTMLREQRKELRQLIRAQKKRDRQLVRRPGVPPYFYGPMGPFGPYAQ